MAAQRVAETGLSESRPSNIHFPSDVFHEVNIPSRSFTNHEPSFDFGELEEAVVLQGVKLRNDEGRSRKPAANLEIFPFWQMRFHPNYSAGSSKSGGQSNDSGSAVNTLPASGAEVHIEQESPMSKMSSFSYDHRGSDQNHDLKFRRPEMGSTASRTELLSQNQSAPKPPPEKRKGSGSTSDKQLDAKTSRRLAQNREAARKSRLRKKAYIQQLETSRIKLSQIEQDLERACSQGLCLGASGPSGAHISSGAAVFDMEYNRWLENDHQHMMELRSGLQAHLSDDDLQTTVDDYISHYDEIFQLKGVAAKSDVFHLITGMWITPAERCFLWVGGFRPSELIKMLMKQLEPLSEQQMMGIYKLQHSTQQAEEALSQGQEQLQQSLIDTIAGGPIIDSMNQMLVAVGKLSNLEGFVRQADILRQQTLHQLRRLLTTRQAAQCFVIIGEYYSRLRALSSVWASRPREPLMNDESSCQTMMELQMILQTSQSHFSAF